MLDEAIDLARIAVKSAPRRWYKACYKDTLEMAFLLRACCEDVLDPFPMITEAIQLVEEALDAFPPHHYDVLKLRERLEKLYQKRAEITDSRYAVGTAGNP